MSQPEGSKPASLEDIVGYAIETHLTAEDAALIQSVFGGIQGAKVLKVIRKVFIPTLNDPELPVEEFGKDAFIGKVDFQSMPVEESKAVAMALQLYSKAVMGGVIKLKTIATAKAKTPEELAAAKAADSSK